MKYMNDFILITFIFVCLVIFIIPIRLFSMTLITEDIVEDTVWTKDGNPYIVDVSITIEDDISLAIKEGVHIVLSGSGPGMRILGNLHMTGSDSDRIIITTSDFLIDKY